MREHLKELFVDLLAVGYLILAIIPIYFIWQYEMFIWVERNRWILLFELVLLLACLVLAIERTIVNYRKFVREK